MSDQLLFPRGCGKAIFCLICCSVWWAHYQHLRIRGEKSRSCCGVQCFHFISVRFTMWRP